MEAATNSSRSIASKVINIAIGLVIVAILVTAGMLAYLYLQKNEISSAEQRSLEKWQETAKQNPNDALVRTNLGAAYLDAGMVDDAIKELRIALDQEPKGFVIMQKLGEAYRASGDLPSAVDMFKQCADLTPAGDKNEPLYWVAQSYFDMGDLENAKTFVQKSIDDYDINWNSRYLMGQILEQQGDRAGAKAQYEAALKFTPSNPDLEAALKRVS